MSLRPLPPRARRGALPGGAAGSRLAAWLGLVLAYIALAYASRLSEGELPDDLLYQYETAISGVIQYGIVLALILWITHGPAQRDLLGLRQPVSWPRAAGFALAVVVGIYVLSAILEPLLHSADEQGFTPDRWEPGRAGAYAVNFAVIALVGPTVEELMFRGAGYSLLAPYGQVLAIVVVGLAFGLVHGLVAGLVILAAFGVGLTWLRARTRSVYPCVVVHSLFNTVALILAVTT